MKKIKYFLLMVIALGLFANNAEAQTKKKKKKTTATAADKKNARRETKDSDENFWRTKMWYGSDINVGLGNGQFNLGLTPIAAYKFNNSISAGIITKLEYQFIGATYTGYNTKYEALTFGGGLVARAKIVGGLFAQGEYEWSRFTYPTDFDYNTNKFLKESVVKPHGYIGLGWASGGDVWKSQISIMRNISYSQLDYQITQRGVWDFRIGFNYNF